MKKIVMFLVILCSVSAKSQTWDEWFNQKKTKLKYIAQQIAAFQVYGGYLKQGYDIVEQGWSAINDIKHGDYDLHSDYFNSLKYVNTSIGSYPKIDSITWLQMQILHVNDAITMFIQGNENILPDEKDYIKKVMSNLLNKCAEDLNQLTEVSTSGSLQMKDDERLQRIDMLYSDMQDKYMFTQYFNSEIQTLALSRTKNINDLNTSKLLYGIK